VRNVLASLVSTALALGLGAWLLRGVELHGIVPALLAALLLGVVNALVRPVLVLLTLPITLLTLGLFLFVINALLLMLAAWLAPDFAIRSFWSALVLAVIVAVTNAVLGKAVEDRR
jgi:putative membrane protein